MDKEKEAQEWVERVLDIKKTWNQKTWVERIITLLTFGLKTYSKHKKGVL